MAFGCKRALSHINSTRASKARDDSRIKGDVGAIAVKFPSLIARDNVISSTRSSTFCFGDNDTFAIEVVPGPIFKLSGVNMRRDVDGPLYR